MDDGHGLGQRAPSPSKACHLPQHLWEAQILYIHFFDLQMKGWIDLKLGKERTVYCVLVLDPKKFKAQYCILWWGYGEKIALSVYRFIHFSLTRRELCRGRRRTHKTQTIMRKKATLPSVEEETLSKTDELIWRRKGRWYLSFNLSHGIEYGTEILAGGGDVAYPVLELRIAA